jgi:hypothetical protein
MIINPKTRREDESQPKTSKIPPNFPLREILRNYHSFLCLNFFKSTTRISYSIAYPKKEEGDDDDEENLCNKEATFKGKDFIQDSGGHHKLEGPIPKLDSAHLKKSKSHL